MGRWGCGLLLALVAAAAHAADHANEFVPEVNAFFAFSDRGRVYLNAALSRNRTDSTTDGEFGAHLDISLKPIFRPDRVKKDWARDRYLWTRFGYEEAIAVDGRTGSTHERRLMLEGTGRYELPFHLWVVNRMRVDFRDLDGESARRYRARLGIEREFEVAGRTVVPYAQAETLYDTRFNSWNRQSYQAGAEAELAKEWRLELYFARQNDSRSPSANVDRFGTVLKFYY